MKKRNPNPEAFRSSSSAASAFSFFLLLLPPPLLPPFPSSSSFFLLRCFRLFLLPPPLLPPFPSSSSSTLSQNQKFRSLNRRSTLSQNRSDPRCRSVAFVAGGRHRCRRLIYAIRFSLCSQRSVLRSVSAAFNSSATSAATRKVNKENRAAGILDNHAEGERYAEHGVRKFVRNKAPQIMPGINDFFTNPSK